MSKKNLLGAAVRVAVALLVLSGVVCGAARADLKYTMSVSFEAGSNSGMPPGMAPKIQSVFYYRGDEQQRVDGSMDMMVFSSKTSIITDCGAQKLYTVDPALNIYTAQDMSAARPDPFGLAAAFAGMAAMGRSAMNRSGHTRGMPKMPSLTSGADESGTVTIDAETMDKGMEQINGVSAHHWSVTMSETATGNVEVSKEPITIDLWTDNQVRPMSCALKQAFSPDAATTSNSKVKYIYKGDIDKMKVLVTGVPVRMVFFAPGGQGTMTMDRTDLSTDSLDASLFAPPPDAKLVSDADYGKQQTDAMMNRFKNMGPMGGGGGNQ